VWLPLTNQSKLDGSLTYRHNDQILSISRPALRYRRRRQFAGNRTHRQDAQEAVRWRRKAERLNRAVRTPAPVRRSTVELLVKMMEGKSGERRAPLGRYGRDPGRPQSGRDAMERLQDSRDSIADGRQYHQANRRMDMFRLVTLVSSEVSAIAFAVYLGFFLFQSPGYMPPLEEVMRDTYVFCGICAAYWWFQSGSLALSGASSSVRMATDILASLIPIMVAGYAIIDFWRGLLPLSEFKQYGVYFALSILLLDITFNAMIMARLSRRYLGQVAT
jgi:hypothetical protein